MLVIQIHKNNQNMETPVPAGLGKTAKQNLVLHKSFYARKLFSLSKKIVHLLQSF
jgi:hypothetical protein